MSQYFFPKSKESDEVAASNVVVTIFYLFSEVCSRFFSTSVQSGRCDRLGMRADDDDPSLS